MPPRRERIVPRRVMDIHLEGFAVEALAKEAARLGVSAEELATFSVLYYLADIDSGRIARESPGVSHQTT